MIKCFQIHLEIVQVVFILRVLKSRELLVVFHIMLRLLALRHYVLELRLKVLLYVNKLVFLQVLHPLKFNIFCQRLGRLPIPFEFRKVSVRLSFHR